MAVRACTFYVPLNLTLFRNDDILVTSETALLTPGTDSDNAAGNYNTLSDLKYAFFSPFVIFLFAYFFYFMHFLLIIILNYVCKFAFPYISSCCLSCY